MTQPRSRIRSPYMEFAKLRPPVRYDLATSGIMNYPLGKLPVRLQDLEITGTSLYGYQPLMERLAAKSGVAKECVVFAIGTSLANHLALAGITEPGDEVLLEDPTYELISTTAGFLGLAVRTFPRRFEDGFQIDVKEVAKRLTPRTRVVAITNLHNPSGVLVEDATLLELAKLARSAGARLLVDEVYLDMAFSRAPRSSFHLAPADVVVTNSLTKTYGLSGLRCGWILAEPELAQRIWQINDLFGSVAAHPAELISVIAMDYLQDIREGSRKLLEANRPLLKEFLHSRKDLSATMPEFGTICFPRLLSGSVDRLCRLLEEEFDTSVAPGRFFGMPEHFRLGIGIPTEHVAEGLRRLGAALDQMEERGRR